jgi:response regulator RpfG family c-di-GMP phosphodiesterase
MDPLIPPKVFPHDATEIRPPSPERSRDNGPPVNGDRKNNWLDGDRPPRTGQTLLKKILAMPLILPDDWANMPVAQRQALQGCADPDELLELLEAESLLTKYQATRLRGGKATGLVLGNYCVLERIGSGGMSVVYRAEHIRMRHTVAVKVLSWGEDQDPALLSRFYAEMRAVARLRHPNIVAAIDAGETRGGLDEPILHYFVMEYVQGKSLEACVMENGPLSPARACQIIYQIATALEEAHKHNLVHRDIKPSNIQVTEDDQAKLLDFGLAMHFRTRMTVPGTILGTIDFMAPEQARDATSVDVRADIYSLGATFFWCLTGQAPFPAQETLAQDLVARMTRVAPSVTSIQPGISIELDAVVARMMAFDPADRFPTPRAVTRALLRFIERDALLHHSRPSFRQIALGGPSTPAGQATDTAPIHRVLIVDDEAEICSLSQSFLRGDSVECDVASSGEMALQILSKQAYDLVLLDVNMPGMSGLELVRQIRANPPSANLKLVIFSGHKQPDELSLLLKAGVDDFLCKPFSGVELLARIEACLRHKEAEDHSNRLANLLLNVNAELEKNLTTRDIDLVQTRNVLVLAMAGVVERQHTATHGHLFRMQRYCRAIAEEAAQLPLFAPLIDKDFIELITCTVPLHDIGMVAVREHILLKPDKLTNEERILMEQHTIIGADTLADVARQHGSLMIFMQMAGDICRHHHERFDGAGFPNQLQGNAIPLSARLTAFADVYDALRSWRPYRPAMSHISALQIMQGLSEGHFDPALMPAFENVAPRFETIFKELVD